MNKALLIIRRELRYYFHSPIAYVVLVVFTLLCGYFFAVIFNYYTLQSFQAIQYPYLHKYLDPVEGIIKPLFANMSVILLFLIPLLSMRLFADEKKAGTAELLFTYPLRDWQIVAGKYAAGLVFVGVMLAVTLIYPAVIDFFGDLDWGPVLSGYLGLVLIGGAFLSLGIFVSSLTENQIIAAAVTFATVLLFWLLGWVSEGAGETAKQVINQLSILEHYRVFPQGIIDTTDLVFYLNFIFFWLFATLRSLESNRWRG